MIQLKSLSEQVYENLRFSIVEGSIKPNERLVETSLCKQFGISRSPLRECFRILESEGLVVITNRKGTFVKNPSKKEIEDAYNVVSVLQGMAAKSAVANINEKELRSLNDLIIESENYIKEDDVRTYVALNSAFHDVFINSSENEVLKKILRQLRTGFLLRGAYLLFQSPSAREYSHKMHKQILDGFREKEGLLVQKLVQEHIEYAMEQILAIM